jgi:hypothetical protein
MDHRDVFRRTVDYEHSRARRQRTSMPGLDGDYSRSRLTDQKYGPFANSMELCPAAQDARVKIPPDMAAKLGCPSL